jgi:hypothetical protein
MIKYYLISDNDEYYDFELYDINKSIIYLDFGYNQLVKLHRPKRKMRQTFYKK